MSDAKSLVERLKKWATFGYGVEASSAMSEAADLIGKQAARIAEIERDLDDQRDKHACALRLLKCDEDFIPLQIAPVADSAMAKDAERYRWLRAQRWNESTLFVVACHHSALRLGTDCPSIERLDECTDAAIAASVEKGDTV